MPICMIELCCGKSKKINGFDEQGIEENHVCALIFLNQLRSKVGVVYGSGDKWWECIKFHTSVRLDTM